ncbi:MAG: DUF4956 domain-containing protein [Woeseiaceae bacterium]
MTHPISDTITPGRTILRVSIYYLILLAVIISVLVSWPDIAQYLPIGGHDALHGAAIESVSDLKKASSGGPSLVDAVGGGDRVLTVQIALLFLVGHLTGTILAMIPVTWTYRAINYESGFRKNFVRALLVMPLCATTIVLLIQDSLALAFGLAALVAAVRFRVALDEAMDGIFIFAAICIGLAAGIGYLGIALVMSVFFCFANLFMWAIDYGRNPVDEARRARKLAKQEKPNQ